MLWTLVHCVARSIPSATRHAQRCLLGRAGRGNPLGRPHFSVFFKLWKFIFQKVCGKMWPPFFYHPEVLVYNFLDFYRFLSQCFLTKNLSMRNYMKCPMWRVLKQQFSIAYISVMRWLMKLKFHQFVLDIVNNIRVKNQNFLSQIFFGMIFTFISIVFRIVCRLCFIRIIITIRFIFIRCDKLLLL